MVSSHDGIRDATDGHRDLLHNRVGVLHRGDSNGGLVVPPRAAVRDFKEEVAFESKAVHWPSQKEIGKNLWVVAIADIRRDELALGDGGERSGDDGRAARLEFMLYRSALAKRLGSHIPLDKLDAVRGAIGLSVATERNESEILIGEDFQGLLVVEGLGIAPSLGELDAARESGIGRICHIEKRGLHATGIDTDGEEQVTEWLDVS